MQEESFKHYLTGIEVIDLEHKTIMSVMDNLRISVNEKKPVAEITVLLQKLLDNWVIHANHEEHFMNEIGFPYIEYHKTMHSAMFSMLHKVMNTHISFSLYTIDDIEKTFTDHIDHSDMQYVDWVKKNKL